MLRRSATLLALTALPLLASGCSSTQVAVPPASTPTLQLIALRYASAPELRDTLQSLVGPLGVAQVSADVRTNSLLVAGSPEAVAEIQVLVAQLDIEVGS